MAGGMLGRRIRHGWLLLALITTAGHADTLEQDAQRFGRLPTIGDARLSPDGTQLLTLIAFEGAYQVGIRDLVTGASKILLSTDGVEFRYQWCEFASATRVVCSLRKADELVAGSGSPYLGYRERRTIREHLIPVDIDGENVLQLVPRARTRTGGDVVWNAIDQDNIIAWLPSEPDHVLIQIAREDRLWPSVYRLDIRRNRLERVLGFRADVSAWRATPNGEVRLGFGVRNGEPFAARVNGRSLEEIDLRSAGLGGIPSAIALEADGPAWVIARGDAEHGGLMAFDLESAQRIGTPVRVENEEVLSVRVDRRSGAPIAIMIADPKPRTLALEDELAEGLNAHLHGGIGNYAWLGRERRRDHFDTAHRIVAVGHLDRAFHNAILARIHEHFADEMLVGNDDLLTVLVGEMGHREIDLLHHAVLLDDAQRVTDAEGPRQNDHEARAVVRHRKLEREAGTEREATDRCDEGRYGNADVLDRNDDECGDHPDADDRSNELPERDVYVAAFLERQHQAVKTIGEHHAEQHDDRRPDELERIGDHEVEDLIPGFREPGNFLLDRGERVFAKLLEARCQLDPALGQSGIGRCGRRRLG